MEHSENPTSEQGAEVGIGILRGILIFQDAPENLKISRIIKLDLPKCTKVVRTDLPNCFKIPRFNNNAPKCRKTPNIVFTYFGFNRNYLGFTIIKHISRFQRFY